METAQVQNLKSFLSASSSGAQRLLAANGDTSVMRTNDILRKEEWELLDGALIGVARQRLIGINDLRNAGLVVNLGGLGILISEYEQLSDLSDANVDFAGETEGEKDTATFALQGVPIPITHKDFTISIRRLMASRGPSAKGVGVDRVQIDLATSKVVEQLEETLFNGFSGGSVLGYSLYGYTNEPHINTQAGSDWGTPSAPQVDVIAAIGKEEADRFFNPYVLYVSTTQFGQLRGRYTDGTGDIALDTVRNVNGIQDVRPGDRLTDGTALLVTMRSDVVDLAIGQDLQVIEWESKGGMLFNFRVMAAMAARVKADAAGNSGICRITGI